MTNENSPTPGSGDDNIYRAPSVDTTPVPDDSLFAAFIGPKNADYYLSRFEQFEKGGSAVSWSWPAFLISSVWLLYRKMWLNAFLYWIGLPVILALVSALIGMAAGETASDIFYYTIYLIVTFVLLPIYANWLYFRHAQSKIDSATTAAASGEEPALALARVGGTSKVIFAILPFFLIAVIGILAAIAIPAYQDYTIRVQVSEGLTLSGSAKSAVSSEFLTSGTLPPDNASAGLPDAQSINGLYVASIEVVDGDVVISFGNAADPGIHGKTIVMSPQVDYEAADPGNGLSWTCASASIEARHLPAACR